MTNEFSEENERIIKANTARMDDYFNYLETTLHKEKNTIVAYTKDIKAFADFLAGRGKYLTECVKSDASSYIMVLGQDNKSKSTINRKISSIRAYFNFEVQNGNVEINPFDKVKGKKLEARSVDFLEVEEVEALLALPDDSDKGLRDRAIMEFMYGTGARVSELVRVKYHDINFKMRLVTLRSANDESRVIPLGSYAYDALKEFVEKAYINFTKKDIEGEDPVFVNTDGESISRQGVWRILKEYSNMLGMGDRVTPQVLRDSFAVHILKNGGDIKSLQKLMGFDDLSVILSYLSCIDVHIKDVFKRTHPRA